MTSVPTTLHDHTIKPAVTTGPITGSRKVYREIDGGLRVPARRVELTTGEHVDLYDTSGPYTDPEAIIDVHQGLPPLRAGWIGERGESPPESGPSTQLAWARAGITTPEMEFVAAREGVEVAQIGRAHV